jgi:hypothetical protein
MTDVIPPIDVSAGPSPSFADFLAANPNLLNHSSRNVDGQTAPSGDGSTPGSSTAELDALLTQITTVPAASKIPKSRPTGTLDPAWLNIDEVAALLTGKVGGGVTMDEMNAAVATVDGVAAAASQSETAAAANATAAGQSAAAAAASMGAAHTSELNAAQSATSLSAGLAAFNKNWLGPHATDPLTDNQGQPLAIGARYQNTTGTPNVTRVYTSTGWQDEDATAEAASANATLAATQAASSAAAASGSANAAAASANTALRGVSSNTLTTPTLNLAAAIGATASASFNLGTALGSLALQLKVDNQTVGNQNYEIDLFDGSAAGTLLYQASGITDQHFVDNACFFIPPLVSGTLYALITNIDANAMALNVTLKLLGIQS